MVYLKRETNTIFKEKAIYKFKLKGYLNINTANININECLITFFFSFFSLSSNKMKRIDSLPVLKEIKLRNTNKVYICTLKDFKRYLLISFLGGRRF